MDPYKASRFRFLDSQMMTDTCRYTDVSLPSSNVDQVMVKTNGTLFAVPVAGPTGQLYVRPVCGTERYTHNAQRLNCHKYAVSSFSFDPFNSSMLMTGADDGEIRLWNVPKGGVMDSGSEPVLELVGHRRKIVTMEYNPVANGIIATGSSDGTCRIWDVNSTKEITSLQVNEIQLQEMKWDFTGSLLCTGMKNREYQIWDARTSSVVTKWEGHASPRRSYMAWLGDSYYLVTTGYSRRSNREVILRDIRNIDAPVHTITADNSPGPFVPFYNPCCHVLWYAGRGDAKLNGIDVDDVSMWTNREGGNCILVNLRSSVKSMAMVPQHMLDFGKNEVDRFVRINGECGIDEMLVSMPHQAGASIFEIYGKCPSTEPAMTAAQWIGGTFAKPRFIDPAARNPRGASARNDAGAMKFIKPADVQGWLQEHRRKHLSTETLSRVQQNMKSLAQSVSEADGRNTYRSRMSSVSVRSQQTVASTDAREKEERVTQNGIPRRTALFKAPDSYQTIIDRKSVV